MSEPSGWHPGTSSATEEVSAEMDILCLGGETTLSTGAVWGTGNTARDSFHPGLEAEYQGERVRAPSLEAMEVLWMATQEGCKTSPKCSQETSVHSSLRHEDRQTQKPGPPTGGFCHGVEAFTGQDLTTFTGC
jgi:hypothetical protein